jgi:hypothetical protein
MPYIQKMGSKEKSTPGNFSEKDNKTISNSTQSKMSRNDIKSFIQSQAPKKTQVVGSSGGLSVIGGLVSGGVKAAGKLYSAFSNASKQYGKIAKGTKQVPIVGKPGKTTSVPASSSTKKVSYANPRISMTKAQRDAAGY